MDCAPGPDAAEIGCQINLITGEHYGPCKGSCGPAEEGDDMEHSMTDKHTPGPWHLNGVDTIISVKGNRTVAKVFHPEADARLIAAAPELLEALDEIDAHASESAPYSDDLKEGMDAIIGIARAAIKTAKGDA